MLYKSQKRALVFFFIVIVAYPAYRFYRLYRGSVVKAVKNTEAISKGLYRAFINDSLKRNNGVQDTFRFNLNEVSWEALTLIPGIGEGTARKIVLYRLKNGKFRRIEDVMKIKGIGRKTYEKLKPYVYVK